MRKLGIFAAAALALAGCSTAYRGPSYEAARSQSDNGYSETRIDTNRYQVRYRLNGDNQSLAEEWALRRAAELTLDRRYDWFQITARSRAFSNEILDRYARTRIYDQDSQRYPDRPQYDTRYDGDAVALIEVLMGNNPAPQSSSVYDARQVLDYRPQRY
jgi:hypothetical protein